MLKSLWNGSAGLYSNQNRLDMIANNISNVNTNGYKKNDVSFEDIMYEKLDRIGVPITSNNRSKLLQGSGSRAETIVRDFNQGFIKQTGKSTDIAINGKGFFRVKDSNGNYFYTRDGSFNIDKDGNFIHSSGYILDIENYTPIDYNNQINIDTEGNIYSNGDVVGKINLYDFVNRDELISCGENLFRSNIEPQVVNSEIKQGFIEKSNVDLSKELTDMLLTQRAFEINSRTIKSSDEMWQIANNLRNK